MATFTCPLSHHADLPSLGSALQWTSLLLEGLHLPTTDRRSRLPWFSPAVDKYSKFSSGSSLRHVGEGALDDSDSSSGNDSDVGSTGTAAVVTGAMTR